MNVVTSDIPVENYTIYIDKQFKEHSVFFSMRCDVIESSIKLTNQLT
jgi:hypothetical protein